MAKILTRCADCAHYRQQMHGGKWKCEKAGFRFRDSFSPDTIADSCPLDDVPDVPRWIAVSSGELPPPGEEVVRYGVIIWGDERMDIGEMVHRDGTRWADWGVTHWMPKPALPKEECGDGCGNLP